MVHRIARSRPDHHQIGVQQGRGRGDGGTEGGTRAVHGGEGDLVPGVRGGGECYPGIAGPALSARPAHRGFTAGHGLHTAETATGAGFFVAGDDDMADVPTISGAAHDDSAIGDHTAADTRGHRHTQDVRFTPGRAEGLFGQRQADAVDGEVNHRLGEQFPDGVDQAEAVHPLRNIEWPGRSGAHIHRSGRADADGGHLFGAA